MVEPRARFGGRVPAVHIDVPGHRGAAAARPRTERRMTRTSRTLLVNTLLVIGALLVAFPLLWMISVSFMPTGAASTYPPPLLPVHPTLDNYRELFAKHAAGRYMFNSA